MAGYIYCMTNDHWAYSGYVKIGYTERSPEIRRVELSVKWHCRFALCWDMDVYDPARAEYFLHAVLDKFRVSYEFFRIDPQSVRSLAERVFNENWREIEGVEVLPPSLDELVAQDAQGYLLALPSSPISAPEAGLNHGPDFDTQ